MVGGWRLNTELLLLFCRENSAVAAAAAEDDSAGRAEDRETVLETVSATVVETVSETVAERVSDTVVKTVASGCGGEPLPLAANGNNVVCDKDADKHSCSVRTANHCGKYAYFIGLHKFHINYWTNR